MTLGDSERPHCVAAVLCSVVVGRTVTVNVSPVLQTASLASKLP